MTTTDKLAAERAAFEQQFAYPRGWRNFTRDEDGFYVVANGALEAMWKAWQARAAYEAEAKPETAEPVSDTIQELARQSSMSMWFSYLDKKAEVEQLTEENALLREQNEMLDQRLAELEAAPAAPAPLTNADVVEAWRTTEARRDDYGWTSCEWFQEGVRFAQRHYRVGAAAPAALAALEAEAKPAEPKPAFWVYEWLHPADGSVTLRSLRPEDHCRPPDRCIPVPLMDEWVAKMNAACKGTPAELYERLAAAHEASLDDDHRACRAILTECMRLLAAPAAPAPKAPGVSAQAPGLSPLARRRVFDAIRAAYDLGYCDKQNGMVSAAREVEMGHGAALISSLESIAYLQAAQAAPTEPVGSVRCPRCWEMMSVPAAPAPAGHVLVPLEVLIEASRAIGHFVSDEGWGAEDMQAIDNLDAYIAQHMARAASKGEQA